MCASFLRIRLPTSLLTLASRAYVLNDLEGNTLARWWVNGKPVGRHYGGSSSFTFDITDEIADGENALVVSARDDQRSGVREQHRGNYRRRKCDQYYSFRTFFRIYTIFHYNGGFTATC